MDGAGDAAELRYVPGPRFHRSRLATIDRRVRSSATTSGCPTARWPKSRRQRAVSTGGSW